MRSNVVDQRLRDVVAGEPAEVVPIAELVLGLRVVGLAADHLVGRPQEHRLRGHHLADGSVVNPLDGFAVARVKAALQAREQAQFLLLGQVAGGLHPPHAHRVDAVRLLHEDVLARADPRLGVHGVKLRRTGDQHHVHAVDHLLVAVEAHEAVVVVHRHLLGMGLFEVIAGGLEVVGEDVTHGHQFHVGAGLEALVGGPGAASAAADHADLDRPLARRVRPASDGERPQRRRPGSRGFQECATRRPRRTDRLLCRNHSRSLPCVLESQNATPLR